MLVDVEVTQKKLVAHLIKNPKSQKRFPFTESELMKGLTPYKAHSDSLAKLKRID